MIKSLHFILLIFLFAIVTGCSESEDYQKISCNFCNGKGKYTGFFNEQCTKCTPIVNSYGVTVGIEAKCSACKGKGFNPVSYGGYTGKNPCNSCWGNGYFNCRICRGYRIIQSYKTDVCPQCKGKKIVKIKKQQRENYIQQQRNRNAVEIISNYRNIPGYPGKLEDDLGRNALMPLPETQPFPNPYPDIFSPYPTHEQTLEQSTNDFNERIERARDVFDRTGIQMDVYP